MALTPSVPDTPVGEEVIVTAAVEPVTRLPLMSSI
jgi:hypothetical protein